MAFIGNTVQNQGFVPAVDYFTGNGSTTAFTLSRPVASVAQVEAVIENVVQNPGSAFTVSGNTITFASAPPVPYGGGSNNIYIRYTSPITQVNALSQAPSVIGPMSVGINGAVGIGGTTNPIINMSGASTNYVQAYVNNTTNGGSSSADLVAYPNNGTDAHGWVDMGITSQSYADTTYTVTGPNEAYLFGSGPTGTTGTGNLVIATDNTGTANDIQFYTGGFTQAKSAAKMVIQNSTGNVGIGTSSPTFDAGSGLQISRAGVSTLRLSDTTDSTNIEIKAAVGAVAVSGRGNYPMLFETNGSERARIDSSGNLLVGQTSTTNTPTQGFALNNNTSAANLGIGHASGTSNGNTFINFCYNGSQIGTVFQATTSSVTYQTTSDYRLKENVAKLSNGLLTINSLNPVTYTWIKGGELDEGFIAHELQQFIPHAVSGEKDQVNEDGSIKPQGVDYGKVVPFLVAAIQELNATITAQAADIAALKAKVGA